MASKLWGRTLPAAKDVHFDCDKYLNRIIPPSPLHRLPKWISRFLGYREKPPQDVGNILVAFWSLVGAFVGLLLAGAVLRYTPAIEALDPPVIFASLGASAVLEYNAIQSPLAQPRNSLIGHGLSAIVGVCVAKLFRMNSDFENLRWIAGSLSCGIASAVMCLTGTVHPPGGATAVLAVVDPTVGGLGWIFIPLILMGVVLMMVVALIFNNIQRRFPTFWWTPKPVGWKTTKPPDLEAIGGSESVAITLTGSSVSQPNGAESAKIIILRPGGISSPDGFVFKAEESLLLEGILARLNSQPRSLSSNGTTETKTTS